jgi:hypothetical protein
VYRSGRATAQGFGRNLLALPFAGAPHRRGACFGLPSTAGGRGFLRPGERCRTHPAWREYRDGTLAARIIQDHYDALESMFDFAGWTFTPRCFGIRKLTRADAN